MSSIVQKKNEPMIELTAKNKELETSLEKREEEFKQLEGQIVLLRKEKEDVEQKCQKEMREL